MLVKNDDDLTETVDFPLADEGSSSTEEAQAIDIKDLVDREDLKSMRKKRDLFVYYSIPGIRTATAHGKAIDTSNKAALLRNHGCHLFSASTSSSTSDVSSNSSSDSLPSMDSGRSSTPSSDLGISTSTTTTVNRQSRISSEAIQTKCVRFSEASNHLIQYDTLLSPSDLRNSWDTRNISRTLVNLERIFHLHGMTVSYPKPAVEAGIECMIRIEPSPIICEIEKMKEKHRGAVLEEQRRQRMENDGAVDAEKLCAVAAENSERCVEITSSSWWLERMNYRSFV